MKITITNRWTNATLWEGEAESIQEAVVAAIRSGADLRWADLHWANLHGANLREADLTLIKSDVWDVLMHAIPEVPALAAALRDGRVDGSAYEGECCCLVGTLAKARGAKVDAIPGIVPNPTRPAERFFMGIGEGDTPQTNPLAKIALEWVEEFQRLVGGVK